MTNLYLVAQAGGNCVGGIVTCIEFLLADNPQGTCSVLFGLTRAVVALLNSSIYTMPIS